MKYIEDSDYKVIFCELPYSVKGFIKEDGATGFYTIFINSHLSYCEQQEAIQHELNHLFGDDFDKFCVNEIEMNAL